MIWSVTEVDWGNTYVPLLYFYLLHTNFLSGERASLLGVYYLGSWCWTERWALLLPF